MKCPRCGNQEGFFVTVSATARYDAVQDELYYIEEAVIDDEEPVTCRECDYTGPYEEFEPKEKQNGNQTK